MRSVIIGLIVAGPASVAQAEPIYLECQLTSAPKMEWKIFLDEAERSVKVYSDGEMKLGSPPLFGPTFVMFYTGEKSNPTVFNIDRTDLSAQVGIGSGPWRDAVCQIPKLKF